MKTKSSFFNNKIVQTTILVSIILFSSAIFISQTDKMFGNAAIGTNITGTMVLHDTYETSTKSMTWGFPFSLPGSVCNVVISAAGYMHKSGTVCGPYHGVQAYTNLDGISYPTTFGTTGHKTTYINTIVSGALHTYEIHLGSSAVSSGSCTFQYGNLQSVILAYNCAP